MLYYRLLTEFIYQELFIFYRVNIMNTERNFSYPAWWFDAINDGKMTEWEKWDAIENKNIQRLKMNFSWKSMRIIDQIDENDDSYQKRWFSSGKYSDADRWERIENMQRENHETRKNMKRKHTRRIDDIDD